MKLPFAVSVLVLSCGSAFAADLPSPAPPPPPPVPVFSWTGAYIGGEVGYVTGDSKSSYPIAGPTGYMRFDPEGLFGGVYGGFNYQFYGNIVLGVEGDIDDGDATGGDFYHEIPTGSLPTDTGKGNLSWFGSARARLGYSMGQFLPYVTGGVALADYRNTFYAQTNQAFTGSFDHDQVGWTAGLGLDYAITDHVIARMEYRYADYGKVTDTAATPISVHSTDLSTNDLRVGLAYKF
jgi:outer membrane immunogenic protein